MMLLSIDTSTQMLGIGLHDGEQVLSEYIWRGMGRHTVELAPQIALMLRRVNVQISELESVAVALGPGSYTGLRIGVALAKGLALSRGLKLVGVPTFDVIAMRQPQRSEPMFTALEAGRSRIAGMWYKWNRDRWRPEGDTQVMTWDGFIATTAEACYVCGELTTQARRLMREHERFTVGSPSACLRRPSDLAEIAFGVLRTKRRIKPKPVTPIYSASP